MIASIRTAAAVIAVSLALGACSSRRPVLRAALASTHARMDAATSRLSSSQDADSGVERLTRCESLSGRSGARLGAARETAMQTVQSFVATNRDPLARSRAGAAAAVEALRARNAPSAELAAAQQRLETLRSEHVRRPFAEPTELNPYTRGWGRVSS